MTIYWDLLLESEDFAAQLRALYNEYKSVGALAERLGVSKNALRRQLRKHKIFLQPSGGPHVSARASLIPSDLSSITNKELAFRTGLTTNYCQKLITKWRKDHGEIQQPRETPKEGV